MRFFVGLVSLCMGALFGNGNNLLYALDEPMQPLAGFGSDQFDVCSGDCSERFDLGDQTSAGRISYFVPKTLKHGTTAPVVVYMHGFFALNPETYQDHIDHLTRQGYIVIFPQYQAGGWEMIRDMGVFAPADQREWLDNAVASTNHVLDLLGTMINKAEIYGYGHSIGGLLLLGWEKAGGAKLQSMVLAHPKLDLKTGMPEFVKSFVQVKVLPWRDLAPAATSHIVILGGEEDSIAPWHELVEIRDFTKKASSVAMFLAHGDEYGDEVMKADHMAPATNAGVMRYMNWLLDLFGGKIVLNTYDYRYYYASLDAVLNGQFDYQPAMGLWSDGHPFAGIKRVF